MDLFSLKGKRALVTGSSKGLGYAMAEGLGEAEAVVILNGRDKERLDHATNALKKKGISCFAFSFDVSDEAAVMENVGRIEKSIGSIDILVNNAGINHRMPAEDFPTERWMEIMNTNLNSVFFMSRAVGRHMISRRSGKIINITSVASEISRSNISPYSTSKGGVKMLTKGLSVEWGKYHIQVNAIGPGFFKTDLNLPLIQDESFNQWVCNRVPLGRWGDPRELIGTVVYLASDASNYITGQTIYVDGGLLSSF